MTTDTRPRHLYRLPDGRDVPIIFDHGEVPPQRSTFQLESGKVVEMVLVSWLNSDLNDAELDRWLASVPCCKYQPRDMQRMAREIKRRRYEEQRQSVEPCNSPPWADKNGRFRP